MSQDLVSDVSQQEVQELIQQWQDENLESGRDVVLVVAGKSGTGKSTLINNFLSLDGDKAAESRLQPTSVTSEVRRYDGEVNGVPIRAIDMPGLHARKHKKDEEMNIVAALSNLTQGKADILIYCISLTQRVDIVDEKNIETLNMAFGKEIWKNAIFVFTHADAVLDDKDNEGKFDKLVKSFTKEVQEMLGDCDVKVIITSVSETTTTNSGTVANVSDGDRDIYEIIGIPTGKNPDKPQGWRRLLLSQIITLCQDKTVQKFLELKHVSWGRIMEIIEQAAKAGAEAGLKGSVTGAGIGSGIGTVIGGAISGYLALQNKRTGNVGAAITAGATAGTPIGSIVGACSFGILAVLAGSINNVQNQDLKREITFYFKVHRKLSQLKQNLS